MEEVSHDIFLEKGDDPNAISMRYYLVGETTPIDILPNFNRINVFVGANNSGKSWFMRYLMSYKRLSSYHNLNLLKSYISKYERLIFSLKGIDYRFNHQHGSVKHIAGIDFESYNYFNNKNKHEIRFRSIHNLLEKDQREITLNDFESNYYSLKLLLSARNIILRGKHRVVFIVEDVGTNRYNSEILKNIQGIEELYDLHLTISKYLNLYKEYGSDQHIYIPTLRSAHALFSSGDKSFQKIEDDIFLHTLVHQYALKQDHIDVFSGLKLHNEILNTRNAKRAKREPFEKFEKFLSEHFFNGLDIDIVAEFDKNESLEGRNHKEIISVHIGDRTEDLHRLGDGIQALIILMYKIFMAEPKTVIFIDEPELNLHPGMQRLFFEQISQNKVLLEKGLTYVISTHSNHFLDLTLEHEGVSIYSFAPRTETDQGIEKTFEIRNVHAGDKDMLDHLGVNTSSVFLANAGIWVEGISDRKYLKAFLYAYMETAGKKRLREDLDYAFLEYAGSNVKHYVFDELLEAEQEVLIRDEIKAFALQNHIYLLADSDCAKKSTKKGKRLAALEDMKGKHFLPKVIWEVRELENLLPVSVWKHVLIEFCDARKTDTAEKREDVQSKIDQVLQTIILDPKAYIGVFLDEVKKAVPELNKVYESKADGSFGTFTEKAKLGELVLQGVLDGKITWDVLCENGLIKELTEELYGFLKR